jgi:CheY-like chemotaxis protein
VSWCVTAYPQCTDEPVSLTPSAAARRWRTVERLASLFAIRGADCAPEPGDLSLELLPLASRPTVLVVDDQLVIRTLVTRILTEAGYDVVQASDATAALRLIQEERGQLTLVLTDVRMPGFSGIELGRRIWATDPALPVLYMSGFAPEVLDFLPTAEQERRWILKPFTGDELLARLIPFLPPRSQTFPLEGPAVATS